MTLTFKSIVFLLTFFMVNSNSIQDCVDGLNLLPMYGKKKKCKEQIEIDEAFLIECDSQFKNKKKASIFFTEKGWEYFYKDDLENSMKRFNQAWLLDSLNSDVYWGFGNILGKKQQFEESVELFKESLSLNPNNSKVHESIAVSYAQLFFKTKNMKFLNNSIVSLKTSLKFDNQNARVYGQLAGAYSYFMQKDSALKYLNLADKIDPKVVNPEIRKILGRH